MRIYGLDFTSAPRKRKPITCVACTLKGRVLHFEVLEHFTTWPQFEAFLQRPGPWAAGFDFPLGQPRQLIDNLGWPPTWAAYVAHISAMTMKEFEEVFRRYRDSREPGDKHHYRQADRPAGALSPMLLYRIPIGRMFFRGAPRLLSAPVSVIPCRPTQSDRIAFEAYPALVARKWLGGQSYKNDVKSKQSEKQTAARRTLLNVLQSGEMTERYGLHVALTEGDAAALAEDPGGDDLDALLCAVQAAWAWQHRGQNYGIPLDCDPAEGWIVDPETAGAAVAEVLAEAHP